jgi:hypothetical protein
MSANVNYGGAMHAQTAGRAEKRTGSSATLEIMLVRQRANYFAGDGAGT